MDVWAVTAQILDYVQLQEELCDIEFHIYEYTKYQVYIGIYSNETDPLVLNFLLK